MINMTNDGSRDSLMKVLLNPKKEEWKSALKRPTLVDPDALIRDVRGILEGVRKGGDNALRRFSEQFDNVCPESFRVSKEEISTRANLVTEDVRQAIRRKIAYLKATHKAQKEEWLRPVTVNRPGYECGWVWRPIPRLGFYVPAELFSSLYMAGVPAKLAGCDSIAICTPPGEDGKLMPAIAATALELGLYEIYLIGGAQAIGALAYGTESVERVLKIFGPGSPYVTVAKSLVSGQRVATDLPAGPTECLIIADAGANARKVAADLLAQAEHGPTSQVILITTDEDLAAQVLQQLNLQIEGGSTKEDAKQSLKNGAIVVVQTVDEAIDIANWYAPEHLMLQIQDSRSWLVKVQNAGTVIVGYESSEASSDYGDAGTNHILPTSGWGKIYSGVNVLDFGRWMSFSISLSGGETQRDMDDTVLLAREEGLPFHANAITVAREEYHGR